MTTEQALQTYREDVDYNTDKQDRLPWVNGINNALDKGEPLAPHIWAEWVYPVYELVKEERSISSNADSN